MKTFLENYREEINNYKLRSRYWLNILSTGGPGQEIIKKWFISAKAGLKHPIQINLADIYSRRETVSGVARCKEWEARIIWLARIFDGFRELSVWESASAEKRLSHSCKIARLARELANALEEEPRPLYPMALELFDEDQAVKIIKELPEATANALLSCTRFDPRGPAAYYKNGEPYYENISKNLADRFYFSAPQELPSMLRRLAGIADEKAKESKRSPRPDTGDANARIFAQHLSESFSFQFGRVPNEVIAACVCLRYPELKSPPNGDTIRSWRGVR